jgi:hypothetical protein
LIECWMNHAAQAVISATFDWAPPLDISDIFPPQNAFHQAIYQVATFFQYISTATDDECWP